MIKSIIIIFVVLVMVQPALSKRAVISQIASDPYISALVVDADSKRILINENGSAKVYPASVVKLMDLLIILERIDTGDLRWDEMVQVTKEAAQMGGSQVYLDTREQFSVEDMLYALVIQSANDAAVALAMHVAGSKEGFVVLMNQKAQELGMIGTVFYSVHGLPPSLGQKADVSTAEDLSLLALELTKRPDVFKFTNTRERSFRDGKFMLRTHNHLLSDVMGADGMKTGYFRAAGFSIIATAKRNGARVISLVMGSKDRKVRDQKSAEFIEQGFALIAPPVRVQKTPVKLEATSKDNVEADTVQAPPAQGRQQIFVPIEGIEKAGKDWMMFLYGVVAGVIGLSCVRLLMTKKKVKGYR